MGIIILGASEQRDPVRTPTVRAWPLDSVRVRRQKGDDASGRFDQFADLARFVVG